MTKKRCFKCGQVQPLTAFYRHPMMKDGRVNKCKECNKRDVRENRKKNVEYYREYDRKRGIRGNPSQYRTKAQMKAHNALTRAVKSGNIKRKVFCEECGSDQSIHAHHDDYAYALDVKWLCCVCHRAWHDANGPGLNK